MISTFLDDHYLHLEHDRGDKERELILRRPKQDA